MSSPGPAEDRNDEREGPVVSTDDTPTSRATAQTDHEAFVEELCRDRDRLRALTQTAFDILWEVHLDRSVLEGTLRIVDYAQSAIASEVAAWPRTFPTGAWVEIIHPDDRDRVIDVKQAATDSVRNYSVEYRVRRKDGTYIWVEDRGAPVEVRAGRVVRWVGAARDITDRKRAEEELQQTLAELRALKDRLAEENVFLHEEVERVRGPNEILGRSDVVGRVLRQIALVAPTEATVLITGETGTGKELVARAIHRSSTRRERPLVTVNCAALPPTLIESELFGHEKGAFTGAASLRLGRFERADGGTIFLDEVGELSIDVQAKLLRAIETGEIERVGSTRTRRVDVRVIAATNRDLEQGVRAGSFRRDLYYRLRVFPIELPPLRERRDDIPLLATYLTEKKAAEIGRDIRRIPRAVIDRLIAYDWPGNVRELENVIERAVILSSGPDLVLGEVLGSALTERARDMSGAPRLDGAPGLTLEAAERAHIISVCEACAWRIKGAGAAAERLGLNPSTLFFRMKKLGITRPRGR